MKPHTTPQHKTVGYAYPTSDLACKHGHGKTGCWYVATEAWTTYADRRMRRHLKVHHAGQSKAEAFLIAAKMPQPWEPLCERYLRADVEEAEAAAKAEREPELFSNHT